MTGQPAYMIGGTRAQPSDHVAVRSALDRVRIEGAVFLRAEYHEALGVRVADRPGDRRLHRARATTGSRSSTSSSLGRCWVEVDGERHWADAGDVVVLAVRAPAPDGRHASRPRSFRSLDVHTAAAVDRRCRCIRYGSDGSETDVVCGYLLSDDPLFDPALQVFPPVFVVRPPHGPVGRMGPRQHRVRGAADQQRGPGLSGGRRHGCPSCCWSRCCKLHLASAPGLDARPRSRAAGPGTG